MFRRQPLRLPNTPASPARLAVGVGLGLLCGLAAGCFHSPAYPDFRLDVTPYTTEGLEVDSAGAPKPKHSPSEALLIGVR